MIPLNLKFILGGLIVVAAATAGYKYADNSWQAKFKELEIEQLKLKEENEKLSSQAKDITVKEVIKYVDRVRYVQGKTQEIIKEVPIYVTKEDDDRCTIPISFVRLHNKAASTTGTINADTTRNTNERTTTSQTVK